MHSPCAHSVRLAIAFSQDRRGQAAFDSRSHLERRCGFESDHWVTWESLLSTKPSIRPSIGTENPIPEEMDHREIAVRVPVMNEMQFLFASEPCKPLKPRSLYVVFLVEKDVRVERRRTCNYL